MAYNLSREARLFVSYVDIARGDATTPDATNSWEILIQDDFSFTQNTETQEIGLNEAGPVPQRGTKTYNTALNPVDWNFSSYIRPYTRATDTAAYSTVADVGNVLKYEDRVTLTNGTSYDISVDVDGGGAADVTITTPSVGIIIGKTVIDLLNAQLTGAVASISKAGGLVVTSDTKGSTGSITLAAGSGTDLIAALGFNPATDITATAGADAVTIHHVPDEILWHCLASNQTPNFDNSANAVTGTPTGFNVDFYSSNAHELSTFQLYYKVDDVWYQITDAQVGQTEVNMDIDGIGMTAWTGQGSELVDISKDPLMGAAGPAFEGLDNYHDEAGYLKNKLSELILRDVDSTSPNFNTEYSIAITGGSFTINNNVTFLTPNTLSVVDKPIGSFTGNRAFNGNLTCYLVSTADDTNDARSASLMKHLAENSAAVANQYFLSVSLGNLFVDNPRAVFELPTAQLVIPNVEVQDVISMTIDFSGAGSNNLEDTDECTVSIVA